MARSTNVTGAPRQEDFRSASESIVDRINRQCTRCFTCRKDCAFLRKYGPPGDIAALFDAADPTLHIIPFECSLCGLCAAVCPVALQPRDMFLEMRREKMRRDPRDYPEHSGYLAYERRGSSRLFSYYALPQDCDTVFFPGCAIAGTRLDTTFRIFEHLRREMPNLGVVLDCCMKISHDLGRVDHFQTKFREMMNSLIHRGVTRVLLACPNCYRIFTTYGEKLEARTIYEYLDTSQEPVEERVQGTVSIHDPCPVRFSPAVHRAVRNLVTKRGLNIEEMPHHAESTLCCGEGGFVTAVSKQFAKQWGEIRKSEAAGKKIITYCAGCTNHLNGRTPTHHLVDLLWKPQATMAGRVRVAGAPFTYINRLRLKHRVKKILSVPVTGRNTAVGSSDISGFGETVPCREGALAGGEERFPSGEI